MLFSIPEEFKKVGYNIKFKKIAFKAYPWFKQYRVHMSLRMTEEQLKMILKRYKNTFYGMDNISYKIITNKFN